MKKRNSVIFTMWRIILFSVMAGFVLNALADDITDFRQLYNDTANDCGNENRPALLCSGLLLKAVQYEKGKSFLDYSSAEKESEGISFSFLRADAGFSKLHNSINTGFILYPEFKKPDSSPDYTVYCAFPLTADTNRRLENGCGDNKDTALTEKYCDEIGAEDVDSWLKKYTGKPEEQCAFDLRYGLKPDRSSAFITSLALRKSDALKNEFETPNEVRVSIWNISPPASPAVKGIFYLPREKRALISARHFQDEWYALTGNYIPLLEIVLPTNIKQLATLNIKDTDQLIYKQEVKASCSQYVKKAEWIKRYDPGFQKEIFSLEVEPTDCGRQIKSDETNIFFNELAHNYYFDSEWENNEDNYYDNIRGMRRQLTCHFIISRNKPTWNLEPSRPYTDIDDSIAHECNNI